MIYGGSSRTAGVDDQQEWCTDSSTDKRKGEVPSCVLCREPAADVEELKVGGGVVTGGD